MNIYPKHIYLKKNTNLDIIEFSVLRQIKEKKFIFLIIVLKHIIINLIEI